MTIIAAILIAFLLDFALEEYNYYRDEQARYGSGHRGPVWSGPA